MKSQKPSSFETLGQWNDHWGHILGSAPTSFTHYDLAQGDFVKNEDQVAALSQAFDELRSGFYFAERKIKDDRLLRIIRELVEMSYEAYTRGESKLGAHTLQEARGMIWTGSSLPIKYAVEAERRAFGESTRFTNIPFSAYPYEGSSADLGPGQSSLFEVAKQHCNELFGRRQEFKHLAWALHPDSGVTSLRASSRKKLMAIIAEQAAKGDIKAAVVVELIISAVSGLIVFHLHEHGRPYVEAIGKTSHWSFDSLRFHFKEPAIFADP